MDESPTLHLIANSHLDQVWLWDWREGLSEAITTFRAVADLMDEEPDLTFVRGEACVYEHIEQSDPALFERIRGYHAQGRWDVVGGVYVQPDTNLTGTETFLQHFLRSQRYFFSRFGKRVRVGWAADSFGHSAGLPEILSAAGLTGFAFSRPFEAELPIAKPAFWWAGSGGSRVLGYRIPIGWYACERDGMAQRLDGCLAAARESGLENLGVFYGLGDHGGAPSRRQIAEIRSWRRCHPEVRVVHSGLHRLFDAIRDETRRKGEDLLPTHEGELNFCLRGCYASVARLKYPFRKAEAEAARAERTHAVIRASLGQTPGPVLDRAWDAILFNSFHDILPGSSIERAYDEQLDWLGGARHEIRRVEFEAVRALAERVDTRVPAVTGDRPTAVSFLVWNPHPFPFRGHVEIEASLDYRPVYAYDGRDDALPVEVRGANGRRVRFQTVATESRILPHIPWRRRVLAPVRLPAMGWNVMTLGWVEGAPKPAGPSDPARAPRRGTIDNGRYRVAARAGDSGLRIRHRGRDLFGGKTLHAVTVEDPWGSWGDMSETADGVDLSRIRHRWRITRTAVLERGPERAALWVEMTGGRSRLELTASLCAGREAVDISARVLWVERSARLKLVFPCGDVAEFQVPGGVVKRRPCGEVPGGRWVRVFRRGRRCGLASDALYGFDTKAGAFRATVARASRYASDDTIGPDEQPWVPAVDQGLLTFRMVLTPGDDALEQEARLLEEPPIVQMVPPGPGDRPRTGSLLDLQPRRLRILGIKPDPDNQAFLLILQETAGRRTTARLNWLGSDLALGEIPARRIAAWRIANKAGKWTAEPTPLA